MVRKVTEPEAREVTEDSSAPARSDVDTAKFQRGLERMHAMFAGAFQRLAE